jgi:starch-binding outer membrane protein, SusD/RagB family
MKIMKKIFLITALASLFLTACNEEFLDPTRPSEEDVFSNRAGLIGVANGLQSRYSVGRQSPGGYATITANGMTTGEMGIPQAGNLDEVALFAGAGDVLPNNGIVRNIWSQSLILNSESQKLLDNIDVIGVPAEKATLQTHASIFKALTLGTLIQFFEQVPLKTEKNAVFNTRAEVLDVILKTLKDTEPTLNSATGFSGLTAGINYKNTVYALLARYYLMDGDLDNALIYANLVDLTVQSRFVFDAVSVNSIAQTAFLVSNNYQPVGRGLGLPASLAVNTADKRIGFYIDPTSTPTNVKGAGFWNTLTKAVPVYLPGEMILIKAEVYARKNQLSEAVTELNKILTKKPADDVFGIGADLPAYTGVVDQQNILNEIYKNRCIELFMSGLKLEDSKRFNRPSTERNRNWYPYPESERFNNTNTPADPVN